MKKIKAANLKQSEPWELEDLVSVLSKLKKDKSRDPHGLVNELFRPGVAGSDFQKSFLCMGNNIRREIFVPKFMQYANIVSIYKGRGEKMDLDNDRGIFIITLFRSIIMKMVYKDKYPQVNKNMSDSNVGARKDKNIRNHIFVLNGIINEVVNKKNVAIDMETRL